MRDSPCRFTGQRAIVTGGASGIGFGCASRLAAEGAHVLILDIQDRQGEDAVAALRAQGYEAAFLHADAGCEADLQAAVAAAVADGGIDILVCAAGIGTPALDFLDLGLNDFDRVQRVNLRGPLLLGQLVARHMLETRRPGSFVFISSVAAVLAAEDQLAYCVSKAGLAMLVKTMGLALIRHGIRVNAVGPGPVKSALSDQFMAAPGARQGMMLRTPIGRLAEVEEIAGTVAFLVSKDAGFFVGQSLYPDGGRLALNHVVQQKG